MPCLKRALGTECVGNQTNLTIQLETPFRAQDQSKNGLIPELFIPEQLPSTS